MSKDDKGPEFTVNGTTWEVLTRDKNKWETGAVWLLETLGSEMAPAPGPI